MAADHERARDPRAFGRRRAMSRQIGDRPSSGCRSDEIIPRRTTWPFQRCSLTCGGARHDVHPHDQIVVHHRRVTMYTRPGRFDEAPTLVYSTARNRETWSALVRYDRLYAYRAMFRAGV